MHGLCTGGGKLREKVTVKRRTGLLFEVRAGYWNYPSYSRRGRTEGTLYSNLYLPGR